MLFYVLLLDFPNSILSLFPTEILRAAWRSPWPALLKYLDKNMTFRSYLTFSRFTAGIETSSLPSICDASHMFSLKHRMKILSRRSTSITMQKWQLHPFHPLAEAV